MRERYLLGMTAVPFVVAAFLPGALLAGNEVTRFEDPEIVESSGLAVDDGLLVTTNDSGDSGRVFTVDPATGETVGVTQWSADPVDVEALAPAGGGEVWVGDIGDNRAERPSVSVARVPVGRGNRDVDVPSYELVFPEGPRDAESLLADPATNQLYVISKGVFGGIGVRRSRAAAGRPAQQAHRGRPGAPDRDRRGVLPRRAAHHRAQLQRGGRVLLARARRGGPVRAAGPAAGRGHRRRPAGRDHLRLVRGPARPRAAHLAAARRPERDEAAGRQPDPDRASRRA